MSDALVTLLCLAPTLFDARRRYRRHGIRRARVGQLVVLGIETYLSLFLTFSLVMLLLLAWRGR